MVTKRDISHRDQTGFLALLYVYFFLYAAGIKWPLEVLQVFWHLLELHPSMSGLCWLEGCS